MRRVLVMCAAALVVVGVFAGCAKKSEELAETTTTDSLLASNPVEQPEGNLAPQNEYQPPPEPAREPAPTPAPTRRASSTSRPSPSPSPAPAREPVSQGVTLEAGTALNVGVSTQISSETSNPGDTWTGEVKENVIVGNTVVIPAGSQVTGVVRGVQPAAKGNRAFLVLGVESITVNGMTHDVSASTDSIIAGSPRARNLGAIAGGAAAGALIGKAVGGSGKGALIGGLIGGAAATGAVAKSKGFQVVVKEGTVIDFTVSRSVKMRS